MSSSGDLVRETNSNGIQKIIETVSTLHNRLNEVKHLFLPPQPQPQTDENGNKDGNDGSNTMGDGNDEDNNKVNSMPRWSSLPAWFKVPIVKGNSNKKNINKNKDDGKDNNSVSNGHGSGSNNNNNHSINNNISNEFEWLCKDLCYMKEAFAKLKKFEEDFSEPIKTLERNLNGILEDVIPSANGSLDTDQIRPKLREISNSVMNLRLQIPPPHKLPLKTSDAHRYLLTNNELNANRAGYGLPNLHVGEIFQDSQAFKDFQASYDRLNESFRPCLLSFAVFPETLMVPDQEKEYVFVKKPVVIKKRLLINWWIGEGFMDQLITTEKTGEMVADEVLQEFTMKGFIEPVNKKRFMDLVDKGHRSIGSSFKMHPLIRSVTILLAKKNGFINFDSKGNLIAGFSRTGRACMVKSSGESFQKLLKNSTDLEREDLRTLFNVDEPYPDFTLEDVSKMKNLKVLYLGRWQSLERHHIEVEGTEFLKGLKNMKQLRFFSLQGISRISELPDSTCKLTNLLILDLRACHNLEVLPDKIGSLKKLTYLDISECYLLDAMPRGLSSLLELQVLKGFVIGNQKKSCTLEDLKELKQLRKLSINISREAFPSTEKDLLALRQFTELRMLSIAWGGGLNQDKGAAKSARAGTIKRTFSKQRTMKEPPILELPPKLEKLVLQCFPHPTTPIWLMPGKLKSLKKLHIRGGKLKSLDNIHVGNDKWTVEILRLKFLYELKMDWKELQTSFPKLIYLEKVRCPKITFCPCDESGVWLKPSNIESSMARNSIVISSVLVSLH